MALQYRSTLRSNRLDTLTTDVGNAALLRIYSGTPPADADAALSGNTLLAELTCASPFAPSASGGVLTASAITSDSSADATGTATFFRVYKSDGTTCVVQGTVGGTVQATTGDLQLNTSALVSSIPVAVTSLTITEGNA